MAARTGVRLKTRTVDGVEVVACSECDGGTKHVSWGGSFHDDVILCVNDHMSRHTFEKGDKIVFSDGIFLEYDGDGFSKQKTRANYRRWADAILKAAESFPE